MAFERFSLCTTSTGQKSQGFYLLPYLFLYLFISKWIDVFHHAQLFCHYIILQLIFNYRMRLVT